jgi:hypothetical protein
MPERVGCTADTRVGAEGFERVADYESKIFHPSFHDSLLLVSGVGVGLCADQSEIEADCYLAVLSA